MTKKEEQKSNQTETTSSVQGGEKYNSEDSNYTPTYPESYGTINNSQAPAAEQYHLVVVEIMLSIQEIKQRLIAIVIVIMLKIAIQISHQPTNSGVENP